MKLIFELNKRQQSQCDMSQISKANLAELGWRNPNGNFLEINCEPPLSYEADLRTKQTSTISIWYVTNQQGNLGRVGVEKSEWSYTDTAVFQIFIDTLATRTKNSPKKTVLILDNASWHHAGSINWHHIEPMYLPAYSPDLNPIERIWLELKNKFFTNWYTRDPDKLLERVCNGLISLIKEPARIASICALPY